MKTWVMPYATIWLAFVEFLLVMTPIESGGVATVLHVTLGTLIVVLTFETSRRLRATRVPGRVKRIAVSTFQLSVAAGIIGFVLATRFGTDLLLPFLGVSLQGVLGFLHVVLAFAIITQAAAVAIAHDMWEDREFEQETEPGSVPPPPRPAPGAARRIAGGAARSGGPGPQ